MALVWCVGVLLGATPACADEAQESACTEPEFVLETPDGCNTCSSCSDGQWACTEVDCSIAYFPAGGCYLQPCVSDTDEAPGLQVSCAFQTEAGAPIPECATLDGVPTLQPEQEVCAVLLTDEAVSEACRDQAAVLEFEFLFAEPPAPEWLATPTCETPEFRDWIEGAAECHGPGPNGDPNPPV